LSKEYEKFDSLIKTIIERTNLTEGQISTAVGRNAGYIAQIRSRHKTKGEEIPTKFIDLLKLHFGIHGSSDVIINDLKIWQ